MALTCEVRSRSKPVQEMASLAEAIETLVESRLRKSAYHELARVSCEFQTGVLTLRGRLPSYYLKQVAQTLVGSTEGVFEISNQVEVVPPERWREPTSYTPSVLATAGQTLP